MRIATKSTGTTSSEKIECWHNSEDEGGDWNYNTNVEVQGNSFVQHTGIEARDIVALNEPKTINTEVGDTLPSDPLYFHISKSFFSILSLPKPKGTSCSKVDTTNSVSIYTILRRNSYMQQFFNKHYLSQRGGRTKENMETDLVVKVWEEIIQLGISEGVRDGKFVEAIRGMEVRDAEGLKSRKGKNTLVMNIVSLKIRGCGISSK
ncbi:unnamed protein product [Vicia faba]|uniref:Uncharacterized protein n=1 Tax=Vicia faba TaxID=3906 RepID=A0AAV0YAI0_VICFA|nr:unnamed protein product [Vicia faba]